MIEQASVAAATSATFGSPLSSICHPSGRAPTSSFGGYPYCCNSTSIFPSFSKCSTASGFSGTSSDGCPAAGFVAAFATSTSGRSGCFSNSAQILPKTWNSDQLISKTQEKNLHQIVFHIFLWSPHRVCSRFPPYTLDNCRKSL